MFKSVGCNDKSIKTFLGLLDVSPNSYAGFAGYNVVVNGSETGVDFSISPQVNIYNTSSTITSDRIVTGNNSDSFTVRVFDTDIGSFTTYGQSLIDSDGFSLTYASAAGANISGVSFDPVTGLLISDDEFSRGAVNEGDFEANFVARSLVTKQWVEARQVCSNDILTGNNTTASTALTINTTEQLTFGIAQSVPEFDLNADGSTDTKIAGCYLITSIINVECGNNITRVFWFRMKVNGTQVGPTVQTTLSTNDESQSLIHTIPLDLIVGDVLTFEALCDSGNGFLVSKDPSTTEATWTVVSPQASLTIAKIFING